MKPLKTFQVILFIALAVLMSVGNLSCRSRKEPETHAVIKAPTWWYNPRQDDEELMFVKANSVQCDSEQQSRNKAYANALALLSKRILSNVSVSGADVQINSNYALRDTRIFVEDTLPLRGKWYCWALIAYPQKEKTKLLERLDKNSKNIKDIQSRVKKISNDFKISLKTKNGKTNFRDGEKIAFTLTSPRDCHVAVFCHQPDGSTVLLFPNSWSGNTKVHANRPVNIPGTKKSDFEIIVGPPYGTDIVQIIACTEYSLLHKRLQHMAGEKTGYRGISRGLFSRGINDSVSEFEKSDNPPAWCEASISVSTYAK